MPKLSLFFYTSRQIAQDVCSSLSLRAGASQHISLTSKRSEVGAEAAAFLSIKDRPVEVRCSVEVDVSLLRGPSQTHPLYGVDGIMLRPGGWEEYLCSASFLSLKCAPEWQALEIP